MNGFLLLRTSIIQIVETISSGLHATQAGPAELRVQGVFRDTRVYPLPSNLLIINSLLEEQLLQSTSIPVKFCDALAYS